MIEIKKNSKVLFEGDSVTDCNRNRDDITSLGNSYVKDVANYLKQYNITCYNKAISGSKVCDLIPRYNDSFKNLKPDYIFLMIGVNDTWHNFPNSLNTKTFENELDYILYQIKKQKKVKIILLEPFIIGYNEEITCMKDDLNDKIEAIKKIAKKYNCEYLSFKEQFEQVLTKDNYLEYTVEGIHLLEKGYEIISKKIIENIEII